MKQTTQDFLVELKDYITRNFNEDCKYGYGWLFKLTLEIISNTLSLQQTIIMLQDNK